MSDSLPVLEECIVPCDNSFDTYNGETLKARLKMFNIPYKGHSLFSGMIGYGNQWAAEYFTDSGYFNEGGWIWHKNNVNTWKNSINEDLFNKRAEFYKNELKCKSWPRLKDRPALPKNINQYFLLPNGDKAINGDIVKVRIVNDNGYRSEVIEIYGLVCYSHSGGYRNDYGNWVFGCHGSYTNIYGETKYLSNYNVFDSGVKVSPKEGYTHLDSWYKKEWRLIHGITGRVKFS